LVLTVHHISYNGNNKYIYYPAEGEEEGLCNLFANNHVSHLWFAYYLHRVYFLLHWDYIGLEEDTYNPNILDTIKWSHYPTGWETMSYIEIRKHFKCRHHGHDQTKPIPTLDDWSILRQHYKDKILLIQMHHLTRQFHPLKVMFMTNLGILHHTTLKNPKGKVEVSLHLVI